METEARIAEAELVAGAAQTLDELRQEAEIFNAHILGQSGSPIVFADGAAGAPLMIIGDGPCIADEKTGLPFTEPSGRSLNAALREAGYARDSMRAAKDSGEGKKRVYLTNAVFWRCIRINGDTRSPEWEDFAIAHPFLERQIELAQPQIIMTLGMTAVNALFGTKGVSINEWRSEPRAYKSIPVIAGYNPSVRSFSTWNTCAQADFEAIRTFLDIVKSAGQG